MPEQKQSFWYVIPAQLAESGKPLKALLYGLISSLARKDGCCIASNKYLANKLGRKDTSIIRTSLTELAKDGWIVLKNRQKKRGICLAVNTWKNPHPGVEKTTPEGVEISTPSNINISNINKVNILFDIFWNLYDKKIGKPKAEKKWISLKDDERKAIIEYLPKYKIACPEKQYRKNPMTFFNNRGWEDEIVERIEKPRKNQIVKLHDGSKAKLFHGRWVDASDINVKINLQYYPELNKR